MVSLLRHDHAPLVALPHLFLFAGKKAATGAVNECFLNVLHHIRCARVALVSNNSVNSCLLITIPRSNSTILRIHRKSFKIRRSNPAKQAYI